MSRDRGMAIPVTVITGYLGAGKTTLLRRIADDSTMRLAILMNEFGEIAIDSKVVEGKNIRITELAGGCVCCSLSGEFGAAAAELLETVKPEWIVVETTGAAEPAALAYDIKENIPGIKLDAIVTLVDADSMLRFPSLGHTGREQIELADILVLNKIDLVSGDALEKVKEAVRALNERAVIVESERCDIDTKILFGIEREDETKKHKLHRIEFEHFDYVSDKKLEHEAFVRFLGEMPKEIYRSKGFVKTDKGNYLMNYVAGRHALEDFNCKKTELVFIGKGALAQKQKIQDALDSIGI